MDVRLIGILDDRDVELPGQAEDREQREQGHGHPAGAVDPAGEQTMQVRIGGDLGGELAEPPEGAPRDESADRQKRDQLDHRFERDGEDHALVVLGRVDVPGAEQDREQGENQRGDQRRVAPERQARGGRRHDDVRVLEQNPEAGRERLQLERDVGQGAEHGDHGHGRGHDLALAVARRDEVRDRSNVLGLGDPDDAAQQWPAEREH